MSSSYLEHILACSSVQNNWIDAIKSIERIVQLTNTPEWSLAFNQGSNTLLFKHYKYNERGQINIKSETNPKVGIRLTVSTYSQAAECNLVDTIFIGSNDTKIKVFMEIGSMLTRIEQLAMHTFYLKHGKPKVPLSETHCGTHFLKIIFRQLLGKVYYKDFAYDFKEK